MKEGFRRWGAIELLGQYQEASSANPHKEMRVVVAGHSPKLKLPPAFRAPAVQSFAGTC